MKKLVQSTVVMMMLFIGSADVMAIEEAKYTVVTKQDDFEIRDYAPHVLAEVMVSGNLEDAGKEAFRVLFKYISGDNERQDKLAMTAPVSQQGTSEKIDMTAPVGQQRFKGKWLVSFTMPASYTLETLPKPLNSSVVLREIPSRKLAAVQYSGFWSEEGYLSNKARLESWIKKKDLEVVGEPIWARYNAPFSLWFLRRNEVLIPISDNVKN